MAYKIVDLFCGAGGMSLGFENAGFKTQLAIDNWHDAVETFNYNRTDKKAKVFDITEIDKKFLKKINTSKIHGVIGGPPCQGFSLAGDRIIDDERNKLYRDFFKTIEIIKPDFFVIENVQGLLSLNNGIIKNDIINRANQLGYNAYFKVLNASDYGVPQNRKRVFFVCIISTYKKNEPFNFPREFNFKITSEDAISDLPYLDLDEPNLNYKFKPKNQFQKEMRLNSFHVFNHENTNHSNETKKLISMILPGQSIKNLPINMRVGRVYSSLLRRMDNKKPSSTIDTGHRTYFHYSENRIISARESARLQTFPDKYFFCGKKISQLKQIGNAVPPKLAYAIAKQIMLYLYKGD